MRNKYDYYVTPDHTISELFTEIIDNTDMNLLYYALKHGDVLDPCAGGDAENDMSYPKMIKQFFNRNIRTLDLREDSRAEIKADYLKIELPKKYDVIITNPPYNLTLEFIKKSIETIKPDGYIVMLVRLNFFGSQKRHHFFQDHLPEYSFVHSHRPSFTKEGTDSTEYCHMVFRKTGAEYCKLVVI